MNGICNGNLKILDDVETLLGGNYMCDKREGSITKTASKSTSKTTRKTISKTISKTTSNVLSGTDFTIPTPMILTENNFHLVLF